MSAMFWNLFLPGIKSISKLKWPKMKYFVLLFQNNTDI